MSLIGRLCVLDQIWRPTFLYFPTVLPTPAEVLQKKTESDDSWEKAWGKLGGGCGDDSWRETWGRRAEAAETTPGERPGGGARRLRRLLLEEREASEVAQTSCDEKCANCSRRKTVKNLHEDSGK